MSKLTKANVAAKPNPATLTLPATPEEKIPAELARVSIAPEFQAALTARSYTALSQDVLVTDALIAELIAQCDAGANGDLSRGEKMLVAQAHALDAIFGECARRARTNMGAHTQTVDMYLRQGLRAQSNCRATWETLANIKNPRNVAFVRQTNIAAGPQQVNNGVPPSRTEEFGKTPNELLEANHGERLDARASGKASSADPQLETVAALDGPKVGGR